MSIDSPSLPPSHSLPVPAPGADLQSRSSPAGASRRVLFPFVPSFTLVNSCKALGFNHRLWSQVGCLAQNCVSNGVFKHIRHTDVQQAQIKQAISKLLVSSSPKLLVSMRGSTWLLGKHLGVPLTSHSFPPTSSANSDGFLGNPLLHPPPRKDPNSHPGHHQCSPG